MYPLQPDPNSFFNLQGKVIVISGGASGIGAAAVTLLGQVGAHVVFGDINKAAGESLTKELLSRTTQEKTNSADKPRSVGSVTFVPCDVTKYQDNYRLFRTALDQYGRIDHAVACAGVTDDPRTQSFFDQSLTVDDVGNSEGDRSTIDINFISLLHFSRIALPFLRHGSEAATQSSPPRPDRSLTFLSSVTGFRDAPGMFLYQTSKVATLGLMRALRSSILSRDGIRVNAVCPGMTETPMTRDFIQFWNEDSTTDTKSPRLPSHYQTAEQAAQHILAVLVGEKLNGKSIYVEGGRGWDFEDGLAREMPNWLGDEPCRLSDENLRFIQALGGL